MLNGIPVVPLVATCAAIFVLGMMVGIGLVHASARGAMKLIEELEGKSKRYDERRKAMLEQSNDLLVALEERQEVVALSRAVYELAAAFIMAAPPGPGRVAFISAAEAVRSAAQDFEERHGQTAESRIFQMNEEREAKKKQAN